MTATTAIVHAPWCNDHGNEPDGPGFCALVRNVDNGAGVEVAETSYGGLSVLLWPPRSDAQVSTAQARQLAAWLIEAAEMVEAAGRQ
jgi:hypothetical protein